MSGSVTLEIVETTKQHVYELIDNLRELDRAEIEGMGFSCERALWRSYKKGLFNKTALLNGKVLAIWGVGGTMLGEIGVPWLLTSNEYNKISPMKFARIYRKEVAKMLELFPVLVNYVDASYNQAVRLLEISGFKLHDPEFFKSGKMYRKFEMRV